MPATAKIAKKQKYSYADYLGWNDGKRYQLINGRKVMPPAPLTEHQVIHSILFGHLWNFVKSKNKPCLVLSAPIDVRLCESFSDSQCHNVFQPDIVVVCDKNKMDRRGILGAPEMVIEILSPTTAKDDLIDKYKVYEQYGVREYWIVSPEYRTITVYLNENSRFQQRGIYAEGDQIPVKLFNDELKIPVSEVFAGLDEIADKE